MAIGNKFDKPLQDDWIVDPETGEKKPNPAPNTLSKYAAEAEWCNQNQAVIVERETYYETIAYVPPEPSLDEAKEAKYKENDGKAESAREGQAFTVTFGATTLSFITDRKTQQDLQTAMTFLQAGASKYTWVDEEGVSFDFTTTAQILQVSEIFMEKANVYSTWQYFKAQIDAATTVAEVRAIVIDYGINAQNLSAQILDD